MNEYRIMIVDDEPDILNLLEKGVKNIFTPSIQSVAPKIYNCSKIRGLPDLIRNVVKGDYNLIEATLDKSEKKLGLFEFLKQAVEPFGINDDLEIKAALRAGFVLHNNFKVMMQHNLSFDEALKNAKEALGLHIWGMEQDNEEIPQPTTITSLHLEDNQIAVLIDVFMPPIRERINNKFVKKTLSLPAWLAAKADEYGVNCSKIFQNALMEYLDTHKQ